MRYRLEPLDDRMVVDPIIGETKDIKKGSLYMPEQSKDAPQQATVLEVGPGRVESGLVVPMGIEPGDVVLHGKYSGVKITVGEDEFLILRQSDVIAIVHEAGPALELSGPSHEELVARGERERG